MPQPDASKASKNDVASKRYLNERTYFQAAPITGPDSQFDAALQGSMA